MFKGLLVSLQSAQQGGKNCCEISLTTLENMNLLFAAVGTAAVAAVAGDNAVSLVSGQIWTQHFSDRRMKHHKNVLPIIFFENIFNSSCKDNSR